MLPCLNCFYLFNRKVKVKSLFPGEKLEEDSNYDYWFSLNYSRKYHSFYSHFPDYRIKGYAQKKVSLILI